MSKKKIKRVLFRNGRLREDIKDAFKTQEEFCEAVGISKTSLWSKLNNDTDFTRSEIVKICSVLNINHNEISEYFFSVKSSGSRTRTK